MAIVAILASAARPLSELNVKRAKELELRRALREIREGLDAYKQASEDGRIERRVGDSGYPRRWRTWSRASTTAAPPTSSASTSCAASRATR